MGRNRPLGRLLTYLFGIAQARRPPTKAHLTKRVRPITLLPVVNFFGSCLMATLD